MARIIGRRAFLTGVAGATAGAAIRIQPARANTKIRLITNWFAQAEQGGFYQALATGLYEKAGLDVDIHSGGPQVNNVQLLLAGEADFIQGKDVTVLSSVAKGIPLLSVAACYQSELLGLMTHPDINAIGELKGHRILIAASARTNYWPWLKKRFGFSDDQTAPYTFNLQPFIADPTIAQEGLASSEPFAAQKAGVPIHFFPFAKEGYPPYGSPIVTTPKFATDHHAVTARFVRASLEGWKSYLLDPSPGNALIQRDNPKMASDQIAFSLQTLKDLAVIDGGDAARMGIGTMSESRWRSTYELLVESNLLDPKTDWKSAFTTEFVQDLHI